MTRFELLTCLFAGMTGGLAGVLWSGLVSSRWLERNRREQPGYWRRETLAQLAAHALLCAASGAALGFLFWLGWGLIAVVNSPWYATGLLFGLACWTAIALPMLGSLALRLHGFAPVAAVHALEWLVTCVSVGLLCAYSWHRYT